MSRAFVKETSESAPPPERMVSDGPRPVTRAGHEKIADEVARLEGALEAETNVLLRETLERDLRYWRHAKSHAEIAPPPSGDTVAFGSRVTLVRNGKTQSFRIVGEDEADPARGLVSFRSPLAQAVLGGRAGDIVEMEKPRGEIAIVAVRALTGDHTRLGALALFGLEPAELIPNSHGPGGELLAWNFVPCRIAPCWREEDYRMRNETHATQALDEAMLMAVLPLKPRGISTPARGIAPQAGRWRTARRPRMSGAHC